MFFLFLGLHLALSAQDWAGFRGPNGSGVAAATGFPTEFSPSHNVAWKAPVPFAKSSPVVSGGRVFLTTSEGPRLITMAFDAASGRRLWRREIQRTHSHEIYKANDPASPTPAADGQSVYAFFPDFGLIACGFDGKERWRHPLGPFENFYGMASSPVTAGDMVLLLCDQARGSYLLALDKASGRQRWKRERPESNIGWAVPIVHQDQILTLGSMRVDSYHLATGEPRWWIPVASHGSMGAPVVSGNTLIVTTLGGDQPMFPSFASTLERLDKDKDNRISADEARDEKDWFEHFGWIDDNHDKFLDAKEWEAVRAYGIGEHGVMAIPLDGKGRLDSTAIRWRFRRNVPYVPSPVLYQGVLYMAKTGGIVTSLDPANGELLKQGRSEKALGEYYASPVAADGKVFLLSEEGKMTVLKAGPQWEVLAVNDMGAECYATPAVSGGRIFVRTRGALYAFAGGAR